MQTRVAQIADGIFRLSTFVPDISPVGFTFNQYLIAASQPMLFHCGGRGLFASVSKAAASVLPVESLRWISFGHVESDESGAMNDWLAAAPNAQVVHGQTGCMVSLNDLAARPPRALNDGEVLDLGGKRVRWIDTPHVPHGWESGLIYEETTGTLFTGDLFTHVGKGEPAIGNASIVQPSAETEEMFHASSLAPHMPATIRRLAAFKPKRLAVMHGSCFEGDCAAELEGLAAYYDRKLKEAA
jgi:flavorubredoxin